MPSMSPDARTRPPFRTLDVVAIIAVILLVVGGLNWALVGLFNFDLVAALFGPGSTLSRAVYVIVGTAAFVALLQLPGLTRSSARVA